MATRKEVADLAGVSEATVSRVFNHVEPLKEETRQRVIDAAKQLDYHPNAIASSFARRRSGNLGVVLPYVPKVHLFSTYYFSETLSGIGEAVRERGYDLLLMMREPGDVSGYLNLFRSQKVDACIILGAADLPGQRDTFREMDRQRMPFCLVNQHFEGEQFCEVDANHEQGSYDAVHHLTQKGYRRIAFLNGSLQYSNSRDRLNGYWRAIREAGLAADEGLVLEGNYSRTSGYMAAASVQAMIASGLDAVFCANDRMAIGLMQGLRERGFVPGRDLAIVGYDDSDAAKVTDLSLTTVHVPFYEMGHLAACKILDRIQAVDAADSFFEKLPTRLVVRKSCSKQ